MGGSWIDVAHDALCMIAVLVAVWLLLRRWD